MQRLFRTAYMVAKDHLSFHQYSRICELQGLNGLQLGENYLTNTACRRFLVSIAQDIKIGLQSDLQDARFMTVLSDGSTDKGEH